MRVDPKSGELVDGSFGRRLTRDAAPGRDVEQIAFALQRAERRLRDKADALIEARERERILFAAALIHEAIAIVRRAAP